MNLILFLDSLNMIRWINNWERANFHELNKNKIYANENQWLVTC